MELNANNNTVTRAGFVALDGVAGTIPIEIVPSIAPDGEGKPLYGVINSIVLSANTSCRVRGEMQNKDGNTVQFFALAINAGTVGQDSSAPIEIQGPIRAESKQAPMIIAVTDYVAGSSIDPVSDPFGGRFLAWIVTYSYTAITPMGWAP